MNVPSVLVSAISGVSALYKQRDEIIDEVQKLRGFWNKPRGKEVFGLNCTAILMANKTGKTGLCTRLSGNKDVSFIDVDDMAATISPDIKDENLKELEVCKKINALVKHQLSTYKHVILVSHNHQRVKACGARRSYLAYASPKFVDAVQQSNQMDAHKSLMNYSHSMHSFSVSKYQARKRVLIYDDLDELSNLVKKMWEIKDLTK